MKRLRRGKLGASTIHVRRRTGTLFPPWHRDDFGFFDFEMRTG
jgi:hypothetical protein